MGQFQFVFVPFSSVVVTELFVFVPLPSDVGVELFVFVPLASDVVAELFVLLPFSLFPSETFCCEAFVSVSELPDLSLLSSAFVTDFSLFVAASFVLKTSFKVGSSLGVLRGMIFTFRFVLGGRRGAF